MISWTEEWKEKKKYGKSANAYGWQCENVTLIINLCESSDHLSCVLKS